MTELVPAGDIERIVGVRRHPVYHFGRAVSAKLMVYILHSQDCFNAGYDLRECPYSMALDRGIDTEAWSGVEDIPVVLWLSATTGRLVPSAWGRQED